MARLEEVSRHPFISKGVRYLDIGILAFSMPRDLNIFTTACLEKLDDMKTNYDRLLRSCSRRSCGPRVSDRWQARKIQELQTAENLIMGLLPVQAMEDHKTEDKFWVDRIVAMAYGEYQQRHLQDRLVVETGAFAEALATAEARMPLARKECVGDEWHLDSPAGCSHCRSWLTTSSEPEEIVECLANILERSLDIKF